MLLILVIVVGIQFFRAVHGKTILVLNNGTVLEVDETSESGDIIFYEIDDAQYLIDKKEDPTFNK